MAEQQKLYEAAEAQTGKVIVGRILPGGDLLQTLQQVCTDHQIRAAAINLAFGTLARSSFKYLDRTAGERPRMVDTEIGDPVAFLGGGGLVCENEDGELEVHFHGALEDLTKTVRGGHLVAGGSPVYNTVDFLLTELRGVRLVRRWDAPTSTIEMSVEPA